MLFNRVNGKCQTKKNQFEKDAELAESAVKKELARQINNRIQLYKADHHYNE
jgi:hypothetical protein